MTSQLLHLQILFNALAVEDVLASGDYGILGLRDPSAKSPIQGESRTVSLQSRHTVPSETSLKTVLVFDRRTRSGWQAICRTGFSAPNFKFKPTLTSGDKREDIGVIWQPQF